MAFAALTAANAGFVTAEFSLVTVDRAQVTQRAEAGDSTARGVLLALRHLSFQLSGAQVGITISALLSGYLAEPALADLFANPIRFVVGSDGDYGDTINTISAVCALILATLLSTLFGELVPKNAALANPLPIAQKIAGPQRAFSQTFSWLIIALNGTANWLVRRLGVEPQEELASARSPEELGLLAAISAKAGALPPETAVLLQRTIRFGDKRAAEAMTPRVDVTGLRADATVSDLIAAALTTGHSRFPVYRDTLDQITGIAMLIDALGVPPIHRQTKPIADLCREPIYVPESLDLDHVLGVLRDANCDLAIVVDEYGGTDGLVTVEDLVEELVGEIADEHDIAENPAIDVVPPNLLAPELMGQDSEPTIMVDGVLREDELAEQTGFRMPPGPYETLAGFLMSRLGHIPKASETLIENDWEFTVVEMERHRVEHVRVVHRIPEDALQRGSHS